jgi:hypothetical protein
LITSGSDKAGNVNEFSLFLSLNITLHTHSHFSLLFKFFFRSQYNFFGEQQRSYSVARENPVCKHRFSAAPKKIFFCSLFFAQK